MTAAIAAQPGFDGAREAARFLASYAKHYHAGAFATPTRKEIEAHPAALHTWQHPPAQPGGPPRATVAWGRTLARPSARTHFTGQPLLLPAGARVITHLARDPGAPLPDLSGWDYLFAYQEDTDLAAQLGRAGWVLIGMRVTAASELIGVWAQPGASTPVAYPPHEQATMLRLPGLQLTPEVTRRALAEVAAVDAWHDDFPFYSDGSWSAVSLRGYRPDDPRWGIKPAEMPRAWKAEHPGALAYQCDWTVLAAETPTLRTLIESVDWWGRLERVRLLRMDGRGGKGGRLSRHTDITDRSAGLADGKIARFHIPLVTAPTIRMHVWELDGRERVAHLPAWSVWYLDARKPHAVVNPTGVNRVHLVADVIADARVRAAITAAMAARDEAGLTRQGLVAG